MRDCVTARTVSLICATTSGSVSESAESSALRSFAAAFACVAASSPATSSSARAYTSTLPDFADVYCRNSARRTTD